MLNHNFASAGSSAVEVFRQQHHVTVAWDAGSKPAGWWLGTKHHGIWNNTNLPSSKTNTDIENRLFM